MASRRGQREGRDLEGFEEDSIVTVDFTRNALLALEREHQDDHDGGYALVEALCAYRKHEERAHEEWEEVLITWASDGPARLWGVALEALAREGTERATRALAMLLKNRGREVGWRESVMNTLLRRGFASDEVVRLAKEDAEAMGPMGLANLACLVQLRPDLMGIAASCICKAAAGGEREYVEGGVPPFVYAALDRNDLEMLVRLTKQVHEVDEEVGAWIGTTIATYLEKPWIREKLTAESASAVVATLRSFPNRE